MRDPEISPWQSSCFRRPRWQGSARWPGSGRAGGGGGRGGGRRTRTSVVDAGLAMRTCQEQRLASLPLPALSFAYLPCPLAFHLIRSLACRSPRALILASCRARVTYNRSLFLIYLIPLEEQNRIALRFVRLENSFTAVPFASSENDCLASIHACRLYRASTKASAPVARDFIRLGTNNDPSLMAIDIRL